MNHRQLVKLAVEASGESSLAAFARRLSVSPAAVGKWIDQNYVPEKSRLKIADASNGLIHPRFFTPLWEK
tara:strand:+ start:729 stop:938 length:210 start_codon:yes stop_codon:yes gene_type:complete